MQRVVVLRIVGLVRQAHADVVGHDAAVLVAQAEHQVAPVEAPRGIAVQHDDDLAVARAFVEVDCFRPFAWTKALGSNG
jgi:hypothetical protein